MASQFSLRQMGAALRTLLVLTVVLGVAYPLLMTGFAQIAFHSKSDGSLVKHDGKVVGSSLIGQDFSGDPAYFQSRPSASGYDPLASGASNLAPASPELLDLIGERRAAVAKLDGTDPATVAPDALLASGSGLDPEISPEYAEQQVSRVARERSLTATQVQQLVDDNTQGRMLGFLGEPGVNVLELNLALDRLSKAS